MTSQGSESRSTASMIGQEYYICYKVMDAATVQDTNRYESVESAKYRLQQINRSSVLEDAEIRDGEGHLVADWPQLKNSL